MSVNVHRMTRARGTVISLGVVGFVLAFAYGVAIEPYTLAPVKLTMSCPQIRHTVRLALFSDVGFRSEGRRERALRNYIEGFQPDAILVAGDFFDRAEDFEDPELLARGASYLESLFAHCGRFVVPGEAEAKAIERLKAAWSGRALTLLDNEARTIVAHGERLDLFGAVPSTDFLPWAVGSESGMSFVFSRWRPDVANAQLVTRSNVDWPADLELGFAFLAAEADSYIGVSLGDVQGGEVVHGWSLIRHEDRPDIRLYSTEPSQARFRGAGRSGFGPPAGVWCRGHVRIRQAVDAVRIAARFWHEGAPEPDTWSIDVVDERPGTPIRALALRAGPGTRRYADLRITDSSGAVLFAETFDRRSSFVSRWHSGAQLSEWLRAPASDAVPLLLTHNPDVVLDVADAGSIPFLVMAGHTHGGQIRIPGLSAFFPRTLIGRRYSRGLYRIDGIPLYITAGVGTSVVPIRFFSPPEVTFITIIPSGTDARLRLDAPSSGRDIMTSR